MSYPLIVSFFYNGQQHDLQAYFNHIDYNFTLLICLDAATLLFEKKEESPIQLCDDISNKKELRKLDSGIVKSLTAQMRRMFA